MLSGVSSACIALLSLRSHAHGPPHASSAQDFSPAFDPCPWPPPRTSHAWFAFWQGKLGGVLADLCARVPVPAFPPFRMHRRSRCFVMKRSRPLWRLVRRTTQVALMMRRPNGSYISTHRDHGHATSALTTISPAAPHWRGSANTARAAGCLGKVEAEDRARKLSPGVWRVWRVWRHGRSLCEVSVMWPPRRPARGVTSSIRAVDREAG
jgi:hypothetical protein